MGIRVSKAKHGTWKRERRNWLVTDNSTRCGTWFDVAHTCTHTVRTYTCTNWTDAMRIADDLANERAIDPNRIIALSENRVKNDG